MGTIQILELVLKNNREINLSNVTIRPTTKVFIIDEKLYVEDEESDEPHTYKLCSRADYLWVVKNINSRFNKIL